MKITGRKTFLCHNSKDKPEVEKIRNCLKDTYEIETFMDVYDFEVFKSWEDQLEREISNASNAAVFLGRSGLGPVQAKEINNFSARILKQANFRIGLVLLPSCPNDLPIELKENTYLGERNWVDFRRSDPNPVERLVTGITDTRSDFDFSLKHNQINKRLRVELLEMYFQQLEEEINSLHSSIESEKYTIDILEKQIIEGIQNSSIDPLLKDTVEDFSECIKDLVQKSCELALKNKDCSGMIPTSRQSRWFTSEISQYLDRIRAALATSNNSILRNERFIHQSGLESTYYINALEEVKRLVCEWEISASEKIVKHIEYIIKLLS